MDNRNGAVGGVSLDVVLFVVFLILKLCNVIDWSWWWVTAPLWIPVALFVVVCVIVFIVAFIVGLVRNICKLSKGRK
jgi:phosphoglycerol transferase MdoB-like AlkP superfamily enzyme